MVEINLAKQKPDPDGAEVPEKEGQLADDAADQAGEPDAETDGADPE